MSNNHGTNQYRQTAVTTANRGQVLIMLYEAAIRNIRRAQEAIDQKDVAAKGTHIGKTHDIINELNATLDFGVGGNIAKDLERLYNFVTEQLFKANIENDKKALDGAAKVLETLLTGWKEAVAQVNRTGASK